MSFVVFVSLKDAEQNKHDSHEEDAQSEAADPQSPMVETQAIPAAPEAPTQPEAVDSKKQAEQVKELGNAAFKAGKFPDAIEHYTRAIGASPSVCAAHTRPLTAALCPSCRTGWQRADVPDESCRGVHGDEEVQARTRRLSAGRELAGGRAVRQDAHTARAVSAFDGIDGAGSVDATDRPGAGAQECTGVAAAEKGARTRGAPTELQWREESEGLGHG